MSSIRPQSNKTLKRGSQVDTFTKPGKVFLKEFEPVQNFQKPTTSECCGQSFKGETQLMTPDQNGNLMLHRAAASAKRPAWKWGTDQVKRMRDTKRCFSESYYYHQYKHKHLVRLLERCPEAARVANTDGQLPLQMAIAAGRGWRDVRQIYRAFPGAIAIPWRGLFPFLQAAAACKTTAREDDVRQAIIKKAAEGWTNLDEDSKKKVNRLQDKPRKEPRLFHEDWRDWRDEQFDVTYELLRAWPEALCHLSDTPTTS